MPSKQITRRVGLPYDKFTDFDKYLQSVGECLCQAQQSHDEAFGQLPTGAGK